LVNKGAVSACLQKQGYSIRLIAAHLSAHEDQVSARNKDFGLIEWSCRTDTTVRFFMGDLNYRLMRKPSSTKYKRFLFF
jgi:endonuclease/exonuclease/phosphatase family metal-dependent hydrolase